MTTLWAILQEKDIREIISWVGGGAIIVISGLWALFVYVFPPKPPEDKDKPRPAKGGLSPNCLSGNILNRMSHL